MQAQLTSVEDTDEISLQQQLVGDDESYDGGRRRRRGNSGPDPMQPPRQRMRLTQEGEPGQVVRTGAMSPPYSPVEGMMDPHDMLTRRIIREELRPIREAIVGLRQDINALAEELRGGTIKPLSESEIEQVKLWFQAAFYKPVFPPCPDKATLKAWLQRCPTTRNLLVNSPENAYAVKYAVKAIEVELRQVKDKVRKQLQGKGSYGRWLRLPLSDLTEKIVGEVNHICDVEAAKGRIAFFRHVCDNYLAEDRGTETPERGQGFWSVIQHQWKELGRLSNEDFKRHHDNLVREDLLKYTARPSDMLHSGGSSIGDYDIDGLSPSNVVLKK